MIFMVVWLSASSCLSIAIACGLWRSLADQRTRNFRAYTAILLAWLAAVLQVLCVIQLWKVGKLYPIPSAEADLHYFQRVHGRIASLQQSSKLAPQQQELLTSLQRDMLQWTAMEVVGASDVRVQKSVLAAMAWDISRSAKLEAQAALYLSQEQPAIERRLTELASQTDTAKGRVAALTELFAVATTVEKPAVNDEADENRADDEDTDKEATEVNDDEAVDSDAAEVAEAVGEDPAAQRRQLATELTSAELAVQKLRRESRRLHDRQQWREQQQQAASGLNARYPWLRLPVVAAGGWRWWILVCASSSLAVLGTFGIIFSLLPKRTIVFTLLVGLYLLSWWGVV